jgi:hypothetical protein
MNKTHPFRLRILLYGPCTLLAVVVYFTLGSLLPPVLGTLDPSLVRWTIVPAWLLATAIGLGCYAVAQRLNSHRMPASRPGDDARKSLPA